MNHVHIDEYPSRTNNGTIYEVCACGASRVTRRGEKPSQWHTCDLCMHPFGRNITADEAMSFIRGGMNNEE